MAESNKNMDLKDETEVKPKEDLGNQEKSQDKMNAQASKKPAKKTRRGDAFRIKFDSEGIHKESGEDACDCMQVGCPGCWMPCQTCSSTKCGHECRNNRKWEYHEVEIQGTSVNLKNPYRK